ncbi:MAG: HAMP domain-containing protein [Acidobacteriia bacterium]|nr:HAMP domain-containing protein [Terriglobia bacterium]
MRFSRLSLLWKILIPTSLVMTLAFAITGWLVQRSVVSTTYASVEQEAKASFQAYDSLWKARAKLLASESQILSTSDVIRRAFGTGDSATIRDTAGELWSKVSTEDAFFLVSDPQGRAIASLGALAPFAPNDDLPMVRAARGTFPRQASGFVERGDQLFQVVVTPVYVQSADSPALLNVLVAGYKVDQGVAQTLKDATGGSEYVFVSRHHVVTSTLQPSAIAAIAPRLLKNSGITPVSGYLALPQPLLDLSGTPVGQLFILRSFAGARQRLMALQRQMLALWLLALIAALAVTYLVARKIMRPVAELDRAAAEIAKENYEYHVRVNSQDELGRLAETFQSMCDSIQRAREELIRQERIATIGQLSTSIVHDLRNPLAAIYAGAEMLMDGHLGEEQIKRLARNIYRASRGIQDMLQQLLNVARGKSDLTETCSLKEVIAAAWTTVAPAADAGKVELIAQVPEDQECPMARARIERVFSNLFENAIEAMRSGGSISIRSQADGDSILVEVQDTGPGLNPALRGRLFQPFVTVGKKNGLGLGLALSRQTLLDHGGDMWADVNGPGAKFCLRLPMEPRGVAHEANTVNLAGD